MMWTLCISGLINIVAEQIKIKYINMKQKFEKALEWIGYGFIAIVSVLVLSTAFTLLWQFSKSIYKVLSK